MQILKLKLSELTPNTGQIPGLPSNPRQWTKSDVDKIAKSLKETPELFEARPIIAVMYQGQKVILGGNLRYEGARKNKDKEAPVILFPENTPVEKMKEIVIKDNGSFGAWDFDQLANEWDNGHLPEWGVPAWETGGGEESGLLTSGELEDLVNNASEGSIVDYNEDTNYDLAKLYRMVSNPEVVEMLEEGENNNEVRPEIAKLCWTRIAQCTIFNFDQIIKFYRSKDSTPTERELLKRLYLVFITPREAVESAMLDLVAETGKIYELEISRGEDIGEEEE